MRYSKEQLIALSDEIKTLKGALDTQNDDLMAYANRLAESWKNDGEGANDGAYGAFLIKQTEWRKAEEDMLNVLFRISEVVKDGAINMSETDKQNAAAWFNM